MLQLAVLFILIAAVFEAVILWNMASLEWLEDGVVLHLPRRVKGNWFRWETYEVFVKNQNLVHITVILFAIWYHKRTIIGTFVAMASGLISFVVIPLVVMFKRERRKESACD